MDGPKLGPVTEAVNPQELLDVIAGASSQDPIRLQAASKRFKEMLAMSGTFDALSEISSQRSLPLAVRQQSIIQLKNNAMNNWRSRKFMSDDERARIRARCLTFLDEEDDTIAKSNEMIMAKIARTDFPTYWNSLLTDLVSVIDNNLSLRYSSQTNDPRVLLTLRRSLKIMNAILKQFAGMKMPGATKIMANIVNYLHGTLLNYYTTISARVSSSLNPDALSLPSTAEDLLIAHRVFKCIVTIVTWGYQKSDKILGDLDLVGIRPWNESVFQNSAIQMKQLSETRISLMKAATAPLTPVARQSIDQLTRHVRLFGKFFRRLQQLDSGRFVKLPACSELVLYYWDKVVEAANAPAQAIADSNEALYPLRFLVQAMVLFKDSLAQWTPMPKNGVVKENTLSESFVHNAVILLVDKIIPLKEADLQEWSADPEEFFNAEDKESDQWEFELRACGERVLMTLCNQCTQYVVPLLRKVYEQARGQQAVDLPSILAKEALYCAIGRCCTKLKNDIDFDSWLETSLIPEVRDPNPNFSIIKRRIAWVIGQWINSHCSPADNSKIWDVLVHLLMDRSTRTDAVVRLTAAISLKECVDSVEFDANVFGPYVGPAVTELVKIIGEADTLESKRRVAGSLNTVIAQAETRIVPMIPVILSAVPQYWEAAGDDTDYLLKGELLDLVAHLAGACKEHSVALSGLIVALIRESMQPGVITYLDQDGLLLWQSALRNTVTIESVNGLPGLVELFPALLNLFKVNLDLLGKIIGLIESYLILGAPLIFQHFTGELFGAFRTALQGQAVAINIQDMIKALNILVQVSSPSQWAATMHSSGLFSHLMDTLLDAETPTLQATEQIYVMARIAIADPKVLVQLISATAAAKNVPEGPLFEGLMDTWWARFDNMSEPRHRKLVAMGMASLVSTGRVEVLQRLHSEVFNLWMDVFCEIQEAYDLAHDSRSSSPIQRYWEQDEPLPEYYKDTEGTPEYDRRTLLFTNDPARTQPLNEFVKARLHEAEVTCGGPNAFEAMYLEKADPTVLRQINRYLNEPKKNTVMQ